MFFFKLPRKCAGNLQNGLQGCRFVFCTAAVFFFFFSIAKWLTSQSVKVGAQLRNQAGCVWLTTVSTKHESLNQNKHLGSIIACWQPLIVSLQSTLNIAELSAELWTNAPYKDTPAYHSINVCLSNGARHSNRSLFQWLDLHSTCDKSTRLLIYFYLRRGGYVTAVCLFPKLEKLWTDLNEIFRKCW